MFLSRGDRDQGDAFQTHPVSQASARGEAKDSRCGRRASPCTPHSLPLQARLGHTSGREAGAPTLTGASASSWGCMGGCFLWFIVPW